MELTDETIHATFDWYAENARERMRAAKAGEFHVNDLPRYLEGCQRDIDAALARQHQTRTGTCPALLP